MYTVINFEDLYDFAARSKKIAPEVFSRIISTGLVLIEEEEKRPSSLNPVYLLETSYDLYDLYNDWVSIADDQGCPSSALVEYIRDNYESVWENYSKGTWVLEEFERSVEQDLPRFVLSEYENENNAKANEPVSPAAAIDFLKKLQSDFIGMSSDGEPQEVAVLQGAIDVIESIINDLEEK